MAENGVKEVKDSKTPFSKSLKSEFAKIIWPTRDELTRQTIAVVCVSVVVGVLIALIDMALQFGVNRLFGIGI